MIRLIHIIHKFYCEKTESFAKMSFKKETLTVILKDVRFFILFLLVNICLVMHSINNLMFKDTAPQKLLSIVLFASGILAIYSIAKKNINLMFYCILLSYTMEFVISTLGTQYDFFVHKYIPIIVFLYICLLIKGVIEENICVLIKYIIITLACIDVIFAIIFDRSSLMEIFMIIESVSSQSSFFALFFGAIYFCAYVIHFILRFYFPFLVNNWINKNCFIDKSAGEDSEKCPD